MNVKTVRPADAGHETLYVLLNSVLTLAPAATVIGLRQQSRKAQILNARQMDARLDLNVAEQGVCVDLQAAAEDIQTHPDDGKTTFFIGELTAEGFPSFITNTTASSHGEHRWSHGEATGRPSYLGINDKPEVADSFPLLLDPTKVWLKPAATAVGAVPDDTRTLADTDQYQTVSRFDADMTRQYYH